MAYRAHSTGTVILNWAFYLKGIGGLAVEKSRREFRNLTWRKSQRGDGRVFPSVFMESALESRWAGASQKPPPTCDWQSCEFLSASGLKSRFCYFDDVSMVFSTECFTGTGRKGSRPAQIEVVCEIG